jgi:long-chain acyl-CoA synthetase
MTSEIVDAFQRLRRESPQQPLLYLPATREAVTVDDLAEAAAQVCRSLDERAVNRRALLAAAVGNRPGYLALFLACRQRNQPLLPLDGGTTPAEINAIAVQFGAAAVLTASELQLPAFTRTATIGRDLAVALANVDPGESRHGSAAVLKMTSGSSGTPRATLTPEAALVCDSRTLMDAMRVAPTDVQIAAIPLSHSYGLGNLVVPMLMLGTPLVLRDAFVPQRLAEDAREYDARVFPGVPFMFDHFVRHPPADGWPSRLHNLISAGAPLEADVAERFRESSRVKIHPFYGTSETGGIAYDAGEESARDGFVGTALPGVSLTLVPHDAASEGSGRLLVRSGAVSSGYADDANSDAFVDGGFLTGDLGTIDGGGRLTLSGRVSAFVNVAGRKVHPEEVEKILRSFEGVADARVLGVADDRRGEQLVACLVMRGARPSIVSLRQFCGAHLASHKIPRAFIFLDGIPLTERGKTDRARLEALVVASLHTADGML